MRITGFGWALAFAVAMTACNRSNSRDQAAAADANRSAQPAAAASADTSASASAPAASTKAEAPRSGAKHTAVKAEPVTLVGCLEKASRRSDYVLTRVNASRPTVGTSGKSAGGQSDFDPLAQQQTRAPAKTYRLRGHRTALAPLVGKEVRVKGTLATADQGRVDVASVDSVSNNCGGKSSRSASQSK